MLKQRLVGALILLALGVIFWPIIFVAPEREQVEAPRGMPPSPRVSTAPVETPDRAGLRGSPADAAHSEVESSPPSATEPRGAAVPEPAAVPDPPLARRPESGRDEPTTRQQAPDPLTLDGDGIPVAWVLQVASVSSANKAEALRSRLLAMDHKAYVEEVTSGDRRLYRVYVGPKFERERLEELRRQIDAQFAVHSMVRRYVP